MAITRCMPISRNNWGTFNAGKSGKGLSTTWGRSTFNASRQSTTLNFRSQTLGKRNLVSRGGAIFVDPVNGTRCDK